MKRVVDKIDATPSKQIYRSIIADYTLPTGICELVDNAIDEWVRQGRKKKLVVTVTVDIAQQSIRVIDNSGGLKRENLSNLVTPGAGSGTGADETIGIFGVGTKRAVVALAEHVDIRTRQQHETYLLEYDEEWLKDSDWHFPLYEVSPIDRGSTVIELARLRVHVTEEGLLELKEHLCATYALFLEDPKVSLVLNRERLGPARFEQWSYPPEYSPKRFSTTIRTEDGEEVRFVGLAGLTNEGGSIAGEFGAYFYCNDRLIARAMKSPEVGFVAGYAGAPHNTASLVRVIVLLNGPAVCMPWNSSKSAVNFNHPTFRTLQDWLRNRVTDFAKVCKRYYEEREDKFFRFADGDMEDVPVDTLSAVRKRFLPALPGKALQYGPALQRVNRALLQDKPWTQGIIDADTAVELIRKQHLPHKNRLALILIDSSLEIAYKDFLVNESGTFYPPDKLTVLFSKRHLVEAEVKKHISTISSADWRRLKYFYDLRCKLIHERASADIPDRQIRLFKNTAQRALSKLFSLRWVRSAQDAM